MGVDIPKCWICDKLTAVLDEALVGGAFVKVCDECLKYDEKLDFCEVDNLIDHIDLIEVINIKKKK